MDKNHPKRRKSKDNPYTIFEEHGKRYVSFKDGQAVKQKIEVNDEIFCLFNDSELHDKKELNEFERHIERSEQFECTLHKKTETNDADFEDLMFSKIRNGQLKKMLIFLPPLQRKRVMLFYWGRFTCAEIAEMQDCSKQAVSLSIRRAREKLKNLLSKNKNVV